MSTPVVDITKYLGRIPSKNNQKPKFVAFITALVQGHVDNQNLLNQFIDLFDPDLAVGEQEDFVGQWVGANRNLKKAINGQTVLSDDDFRVLIKAVIALNHWDGTVPGAYAIWDTVFQQFGYQFLIQDNQDMSMSFILLAGNASTVVLALLTSGELLLVPAGVWVWGYFRPGQPGEPIFGFDAENDTISGWDVGYWSLPITA